jgi:hypothetical protein
LSALMLMILPGGCTPAGGSTSAGGPRAAGPARLEFTFGSIGLIKEGKRIRVLQLQTLFSTMPRPAGAPPESAVISRQPLAPEVFADLWALLRAFDFGPFARLGPDDFSPGIMPTDTTHRASLSLRVDGKSIISIHLPPGELKNAALRARLRELHESVDRLLRTEGARQGLTHLPEPGELTLVYGRTRLVKGPQGTFIHKYYLFPPESEALARELPRLTPLAKAHPARLQVTESTLQVALTPSDFTKLWRALQSVDVARLGRLGRGDFLFRPQPVTWELYLAVDRRPLLHLMYTDRELAPAVAAHLSRFERLLDDMLWHKIRELNCPACNAHPR